jgi:PKD repeat protein
MKTVLYTLTFLFTLLSWSGLRAQSALFIDTTYTVEQMLMDFFDGADVTISNVTFMGDPLQVAYFEGANTDLGVNAGLVLSTGNVLHIAAPATASGSTSTYFMGPGYLLLSDLAGGGPSFDAAVIEFDVTLNENGMYSFQYVFGSEEYPEFVNSTFNDVFGFFVEGISPVSDLEQIALVPGDNIPVAINNVNDQMNSQYYVDNQSNQDPHVMFDGLTTPLLANFNGSNGNTYRVRIGVADIADGVFDSGVFIGIESLNGDSLLTPPAVFALSLDGNTVALTNESRYATSWHWDFGDGTNSTERHPAPHEYAAPGAYTITLTTQNWCCTDVMTLEVPFAVSANEVSPYANIRVHPNPFTQELRIEGLDLEAISGPVTVQLFNGQGQLVSQSQVQNQASQQVLLPELPGGVYWLRILHNNQYISTQKLIRL